MQITSQIESWTEKRTLWEPTLVPLPSENCLLTTTFRYLPVRNESVTEKVLSVIPQLESLYRNRLFAVENTLATPRVLSLYGILHILCVRDFNAS